MSQVYYIPFRSQAVSQNTIAKIKALYAAANLNLVLGPKDLTAVKVHFGEIGNDTFVPHGFSVLLLIRSKLPEHRRF